MAAASHADDFDVTELDDETRESLRQMKEEDAAQQAAEEEGAAGGGGFWRSTASMTKKLGGYSMKSLKYATLGTGRLLGASWRWATGKPASGLTKEQQEQIAESMKKLNATRHEHAAIEGGLRCPDQRIVQDQRSLVMEMMKQMGRNLLNGKDLTSVTFPARCSQPRTVLQVISDQSSFSSNFLTKAARASDPLERLKLVIANYVAGTHCTTGFYKPLNPILGETYQAQLSDGSLLYMEQVSHHPPVASWQVFGPNNEFHFHGWVKYAASFGYNRIKIEHQGERVLDFADGGQITFTNPRDEFTNVFWGDLRHQTLGVVHFRDTKNRLSCDLEFAPAVGLPSDAVFGVICRTPEDGTDGEGEALCTVEGSWLGFIEFDGVRYWDIHKDKKDAPVPVDDPLPSDSRYRKDLILLAQKKLEEAQDAKTELEEIQRNDRKLRAAHRGAAGAH